MAKLDLIITELRQRLRSGNFGPEKYLPTQKELAKELGVAVGTIRTAMGYLQEEGVVTAVRGKGTVFTPEKAKQQNGDHKQFGLLIAPEVVDDPALMPIVRSIQDACDGLHARKLHRIVAGDVADREKLRTIAETLDAILVLGPAKPAFAQSIVALGKPVVFSGELYAGPCPDSAGQVAVEAHAVAQTCLLFLTTLNHQQIALVRGCGTFFFEGLGAHFQSCAEKLGVGAGCQQIAVPMDASGDKMAEMIMALPETPTAIVVEGGMKAGRLMLALIKRGVRVPEDMSLLAINSVDPELLVTPDISRVELYGHDVGEKILTAAEEMIASHIAIRVRTIPYWVKGKTCVFATGH